MKYSIAAGIFMMAGLSACVTHADTLDEVLERGFVRCGIDEGAPGFSTTNNQGERVGFLADQCKAVSAALFGKFNIEYVLVSPQTAFISVQTRRIDILTAAPNWTFVRDVTLGLDFAGVALYHSQGFVVRKSSGVSTVSDLDGATICVTQGTTAEQNLADYFSARRMRFTPVTFSRIDLAVRAYDADRCDAVTTEQIPLAGHASVLTHPDDHIILEQTISKAPTSVVVRQGDYRWTRVVRWALNALLEAEALGINKSNVETLRRSSSNPDVRTLLGVQGKLGEQIGISNDWAYHIIRLVGNYDDIWRRHFSRWKLNRGINALWRDGGLLLPVPVQ